MSNSPRFPHAPVWAVALLTLAATGGAYLQAIDIEEERARAALDSRVAHLEFEIRRRLSALQGLLSGAQGLFAASHTVERDEWRHFVDRTQLPTRWPEVYNFAYTAWVPRADREAWLVAIRADGAPDFAIHPAGDPEAAIVVTYAEPQARNAAIVGYDITTRPPSAEAMLRARDSGDVAMSRGIRLVQEPALQMSVLISLPVYRNGAPRGTLEERRASFQGCVSLAVRLADLMSAALEEVWAGSTLRLYDGSERTKDRELFAREGESGAAGDLLDRMTTIDFAGQRWTLDVGTPARALRDGSPRLASLLLLAGLGFSALLTVLVWSLVTRETRAMALAARMTADLQISAERRAHEEEELKEANRMLAEAMAKIEATQQDVVQQERLRAIGTMASGIAHDFNNSLAAILGFTELLLLRDDLRSDPEAIRKHLLLIRTAAQDASGVVSRLREFYRQRDDAQSAAAPLDLNRVVEGALALTRPRWKDQAQAKGIEFDVRPRLETDLPQVRGDETEVREALVSLIANAVEAMPQGGWLTLTTRSNEKKVFVEIEDTGVGMGESVLRRCMEPFFTTKGPQASGLGLSTAYGVMQRHGGSLEVESAPGEGTRVRLTFPVLGRPTPSPESTTIPVAAGLAVLVVDDDPLVQQVVAGYLTAAGHKVETASDGQEGLQKFLAGRFDLIVTDQGMPALTGVQLAAAVKRAAPKKPIILLTGWGEQMQAAGERPAGIDRILNKPVTLQDLLDAVSQVVSRAR